MSFYSHSELLEPIPGRTVKTFKARQIASGRFVMVHLLVGGAAGLQRQLEMLAEEKRAQVLDKGSNDGTHYGVTVPLPAGMSFDEWLTAPAPEAGGSKDLGSGTGQWDITRMRATMATPQAPPAPPSEPGEFRRMFQAPAPAPQAEAPIAAAPPPKSAEPGEFTRMFQAPGPWHASRRASGRRVDEGTEMFLSLVDLSGRPIRPDAEALTVRTTCTNRDLPSRLPFGNEAGDFELEGAAPVKRIVALVKPTDTLRPPQKHALWRLISTLSLNYLSLVEGGAEALQEILRLYNFTGSAYAEKQIQGPAAVSSKRHVARVISENGVAFARGTLVDVTFDEDQFAGGGVFLFAAVLEYFLGLYAGLNSFSQLVARSQQRKEAIRRWPPRAGQKVLI